MAEARAGGIVDIVIKLGGGVLASAADFHAVLKEIGAASWSYRLLVVPGGGPFADAVRVIDRRFQLSDTEAHWMAVLAMDQFAHLVRARLDSAVLVEGADEIAAAIRSRSVPVLAPFRWLRKVDPLPHSWDVTSDSISAWFADQVGARRLVLIKPAGASGSDLVDAHFGRVLARHITPLIVSADRLLEVRSALGAV